VVFLPNGTCSNIRHAKLMLQFKCLHVPFGGSHYCARKAHGGDLCVGSLTSNLALSSCTRKSTHHCPELAGTSCLNSSRATHARKLYQQGPLHPQELCTLYCKGCESDRDGVVGLGHSSSPRSYELVNMVSHGAVSSSSSTGPGSEGQRGWVPPTSLCGRAIDIP
jgi:hypothetical protein